MKSTIVLAIVLLALCRDSTVSAVSIDMVIIGNPGNAAVTRYDATGFGSVGYHYQIGKTEVTNAQYVEFLNGVDLTGANTLALYNSSMTSYALGGIIFTSGAANGSKYSVKTGRDNNPVVFVSWYDSIRFANWLHNDQGNGNTENGAYTLLGGTPTPSNGLSITRNASAKWWLPSEDEWYKAAYHKNDGVAGNYWVYPTSTDAVPYSDQPPGSGAPDKTNAANFYKNDSTANGYDDGYAVTGSSFVSSQNYLSDVGAYMSAPSPYGTFDQGGNVWEWNEALNSGNLRGLRGGSWGDLTVYLHARVRSDDGMVGNIPTIESPTAGFRVASVVPEPGSVSLCVVWVIAMVVCRRTRRLDDHEWQIRK